MKLKLLTAEITLCKVKGRKKDLSNKNAGVELANTYKLPNNNVHDGYISLSQRTQITTRCWRITDSFFFTPCSRRGGNSGLFNLRNAQIIDEEVGTFVTYLKSKENTFEKSGETNSGVTWLAYPKILKFEVFDMVSYVI